ncbi:transposase family protein [Streptomyces sp. NBC_01571]|uniref:hypothetical protein n=1 Tax=Streptomyces sp. NBC_01571 TaxID=2975883 RepID=UPI0022582EBC|nr:hypothetical protein [Streptomyces sp. NBC_01571]MCX4580195.1 transposase family protein [Streptomyces sp. NBC_01571]
MFAYAGTAGMRLRIDGAETQVRRPKTNGPGRRAFVSGKKKQNTVKTTTVSDGQGRGRVRPGRMVDEGYRGLANEFPDQISAPPTKPKGDAPLGEQYAWREMRRRQSSQRICVEHANAELRQWCPLQRYTGPREDCVATHQAIASLVSDRSARRPTRRKPSTEFVLARQAAC